MMKIIQNDKGYTLILTLILILIVVTLFSSFAFGAITQQKQVEQTDDNFEVTAIAEMGVEYYRNSILNFINYYIQETQREVDKIRDNPNITEVEKKDLIEAVNSKYMKALKDDVLALFMINPAGNTILEPPSQKYFKLEHPPNWPESSVIVINVIGVIKEKMKESRIEASFNYPTNLVTAKPNNNEGNDPNAENENDSGNPPKINLINPPDFSIAFPTNECIKPITQNRQPCYTSDLNTLNSLNNNIVFYTGNEIKNFPQSNNKDYNNSYIYANGKVYFNWLNQNKNISIQISGEGTLPQFKNSENISIYLKGPGFHDEMSGSVYKLYGEGLQTFKSTIDLEKSTLDIQGEAIFNNSIIFKNNSKINATGNVSLKNRGDFYQTEATFFGVSTFNNSVYLNESSTMNLNSISTFHNTLDINNSKFFALGESTFKNDLRLSSGFASFNNKVNAVRINSHNNSTVCFRNSVSGNPGLNIDQSSNIFILDETGIVKQNTTYNKWGDKNPVFMSLEEFESSCPSNSPPESNGSDYVYTILPKLNEDDFTIKIKYN